MIVDNHERAARGERAKELLENPLLIESMQTLRKQLFEEWAKTGPLETAERERLHVAFNVVPQLEAVLRVIIGDGAVAASHIAKLAKGK